MHIDNLIASIGSPLIDVRSEGEFEQGHIPGAVNVPLLNNDERKQVGICYKKRGQQKAIELGYELVGHKFKDKLQSVQDAINGNKVGVYCWRGGLRSELFTKILVDGGLEADRLQDGYRTFRNWALEQFDQKFPLVILGGPTGCGKTELLHLMREKGEQIIDLEGLAKHKGSAYGGIQMGTQPTVEHFENQLALELHQFDRNAPIWVENESRLLGRVKLPDTFYEQMRSAKVTQIELPLAIRIERISKEYAVLPKKELIAATAKLEKRLGNQKMNKAIEHIGNEEFDRWIEIMLAYYDKSYAYGNSLRDKKDVQSIELLDNDMNKNADLIIDHYHQQI